MQVNIRAKPMAPPPPHLNIAKFLILNGAPIHHLDNDGQTPLHEAASWDQQKIVKLFIVHGANVNTKGADGRGPLHIAIANGNMDIANLLKRHGAKL